ncbi:MAG: site-2 protease family protein [Lachnospiraceae bacterium]|nr:site-2 protease family protein [Lachnospiraceae bacterium]
MFTVRYFNKLLYELIYNIIYIGPAILVAITFHEYAHASVSYLLGDTTAKTDGRMTLNPLKHLDPVGLLCLLFFHFGWAKPVRVNTRHYKNPKAGIILVSLAGPAMNFLWCFIGVALYYVLAQKNDGGVVYNYFVSLAVYLASINAGLGLFNLIPIPPLDGSNVLMEVLPVRGKQFLMKLRPYAPYILLILLVTGLLNVPLSAAQQGIINLFLGWVKKIASLFIHTAGMDVI